MSYPYGMKAGPVGGAALPGLPRRAGDVRGELVFPLPGLHRVSVPEGVTSICALVGASGGGGWGTGAVGSGNFGASSGAAGGLAYKNNIPVTPGQIIDVYVPAGGAPAIGTIGTGLAASGGAAYVIDTSICAASGGQAGATGVVAIGGNVLAGDGGGKGGDGATISAATSNAYASGGAAPGYSGNGGGGVSGATNASLPGNPGTGGGAASGRLNNAAFGSGGVGIYGVGASGTDNGQGGSGGQNGSSSANSKVGFSGAFCAGGSASESDAVSGQNGFARILWGDGRAFPSTDVGPS